MATVEKNVPPPEAAWSTAWGGRSLQQRYEGGISARERTSGEFIPTAHTWCGLDHKSTGFTHQGS